MKKLILFALFTGGFYFAKAQSAEDSIKKTVNNLFKSMNTSDTALLKSCFAENAVLHSIQRNREGQFFISANDLPGFIDFIAKAKPGSVEEKIEWSEKILIDGPLASVWTPYTFYFNGIFSHCGVDSYQLLRTAAGWKIVYLIDTRRKDCSAKN